MKKLVARVIIHLVSILCVATIGVILLIAPYVAYRIGWHVFGYVMCSYAFVAMIMWAVIEVQRP